MPKPETEANFWDGLNFDEYKQTLETPASVSVPVGKSSKKSGLREKTYFLFVDAICAVLWLYFFTKLFVIDIDQKILQKVAPNLLPVLDYRLAIYLVMLIVSLIFIKRSWIILGYFLMFPFKVLIWYPAKLVYRRRSWVLGLTLINLAANGIKYIKYHLLSKSILLLSVIMIGFTNNAVLIIAGSLLLLVVLYMAIQKIVIQLASGSYFLFSQQALISRFLNSGFVTGLIKMDDKFKGKRASELTKEDIAAIGTSLQIGIAANRMVYLWANQLEKYKRSLSSQLLLFLPYISLFFSVSFIFSFLNLGLYKLSAENFYAVGNVSWIRTLYYSFVGLVFGETSGLTPNGTVAYIYKIVLGIIGVLLIAGFVLSLAISWRKQQDTKEFQEQIVALRKQGKKLEEKLSIEYGLASIADAVILLQKLANISFLGLLDKILPLDLKLLATHDGGQKSAGSKDLPEKA